MSRKTTIKKNLEELEELLRLVEKKVYVHRESLFMGIEIRFVCVTISYSYIYYSIIMYGTHISLSNLSVV